ncbi:hypothetical protein DFH09DRAFT_1102930 [Mycena vulgaris]|nr:hypothetical protein DFH09DRAFT_1102930 [Mycena vulgaris]
MGELSDESETPDEGITQGFLGCGLGSTDGVGLSTNSGINNTGIDAVYASLLWYLYVDTNATSGAEGYRMYCTPTSNGTRIVGYDDSAEKLLTVAVGPQANLTSKVETQGRTYRWNITQIEFHTYPPFGIPQRLYTRQRKLHHDGRGTLATSNNFGSSGQYRSRIRGYRWQAEYLTDGTPGTNLIESFVIRVRLEFSFEANHDHFSASQATRHRAVFGTYINRHLIYPDPISPDVIHL